MITQFDCYNPEIELCSRMAASFAQTGRIDPLGFYLILDWKAPRARTKHLQRLAKKSGTFEDAVSELAVELHAAHDDGHKLEILMTGWGFQLPTATAILAVLHPENFTIYDWRVCEALKGCADSKDFTNLKDRRWSPQLWSRYKDFATAVRNTAPPGLSLRDCDRWLWGQSKQTSLSDELRAPSARPATG